MGQQERFRCVIYRGGTSKALFFNDNELPQSQASRDRVLLAAFGSPDGRQVDGLGGADITTSKTAIIGPPSRQDADIDYTFGQVSLQRAEVSYQGNCGNISSAVGPYAIDEGLVRPSGSFAKVRIHNTNTRKILVARFPVVEGKAAVDGDFSIPGVPGTSAMIEMDYAKTVGSATDRLLPTGKAMDELQIENWGKVRISIVDVANPVVFVRAEDVGASGLEHREEIKGNEQLMELLEKIRSAGAEAAGMVKDRRKATKESPLAPQVAFVRTATDYTDYASGRMIAGHEVDFLSRVIFNQMPVEAYTGTGSVCTAVAAMIPGTIVNAVASSRCKKSGKVRIGHPRGVMELEAWGEEKKGEWRLSKAVIRRTARRLMDGYVLVRKSQWME